MNKTFPSNVFVYGPCSDKTKSHFSPYISEFPDHFSCGLLLIFYWLNNSAYVFTLCIALGIGETNERCSCSLFRETNKKTSVVEG